jgi:hypothetical protein
MSLARNLARLFPNASGLLPNANIEAMAASKLTGQVPDANAPSGSVIQVVSATSTASVETSSTTFTNFLSASITPSSASNKILCLATYGEPDILTGYVFVKLFRSGSEIFKLTTEFGRGISASAESHYSGASLQFLDSPATTSATTYNLGLAVVIGGTARIGNGGGHSLVLMEIAA